MAKRWIDDKGPQRGSSVDPLRHAPEARPYERGVPGRNGYCSGCSRGDAYLAAAGASNPSRTLRWAAKRSETAGGLVELEIDAIRASGFCGKRFGHVRAWAMTDSLRSVLQWRQR